MLLAIVLERIRILGPGGGFAFSDIHNVHARTPAENLRALFETLNESRSYPL